MSNPSASFSGSGPAPEQDAAAARALRRRHAADRRFRLYGLSAVVVALIILVAVLGGIAFNGVSAFLHDEIVLDVKLSREVLGLPASGTLSEKELQTANYTAAIRERLRELEPGVSGRQEKRDLYSLLSPVAGFDVQRRVLDDPALVGHSVSLPLPISDEAGRYIKGELSRDVEESRRKLSDQQLDWLDGWREQGFIVRSFNTRFLTGGDSREPEVAGLGGALVGSFWTLLVTLALSFPLGVAAAVHLEEFAPRGRMTDFLEVNINNLAAVPSIVYGLLGLAVFLNFGGLPRSAPLVGGLVLALMTLPTIIIAARAALRAVPPSIREAALGIGASPLQVLTHHVLPLALPGILTGTIIGMARALGETAPLLMIGMVAFIADVPSGPLDPATVLPVQTYLWADSPERAFRELTYGAILVLVAFLLLMNGVAIFLRNRSEKSW
jgi:phosphate transport system permease protein